jgi:arsenate reductase (glutaredoxin)
MMANMNKPAITLYGIRNCDTVKKARDWLTERGVDYQFHDFKLLGVPVPQIDRWLAAAGWERLLNRQGPTWRKLADATKASVVDAPSARAVMLASPSVIKRPVVEWGHTASSAVTVGFKPELWSGLVEAK